MRRLILSAALACAATLAPLGAQADPDFDRSLDRVAADPAALAERVAAQPRRARAWFYAYVFDLTTPGLPDQEKARIRQRARIVADRLAADGDVAPRVLLDGETDGRLAARAQAVQRAMDAIRRPMDALPLTLTASTDVRGVFYGLLHRAALSRRALGGKAQAAALTEAARLLAAGWWSLTGRDALWRALPPVEPDDLSVIDGLEYTGLGALIDGRPADARAALERARAVELAQQGAGPRASLMRGALAEAHLAAGDVDRALRARQAMLDELRAVGNPWLIARARSRDLEIRLERGETTLDIGAILEVPQAATDLDIAPLLLRSAGHLRAAGAALIPTDDARARALLDAAGALFDQLRDAGVIEATVPAEQRAREATARAAASARVDLERARLSDARGRLDEAWALASAAREALAPDDGPAADAFLARLALDRGTLDVAARYAVAAEGAAQGAMRAANRGVLARIRLVEGRAAPAFAWANAGLRSLIDAGLTDVERPLRVQLHRIAAHALWADGRPDAAEARLLFAQDLAQDPAPAVDVALELAAVQRARGDDAAARATLARVGDPRTRVAAGCLSVDTPSAVSAALAGIGPETLSRDPALAARAWTCRNWTRKQPGPPPVDGLTDPSAAPIGVAAALPPAVRAALRLTLAAGDRAEAQRRAAIVDLRRALLDGRPRLPHGITPIELTDAVGRLAVDDWASARIALAAAALADRRWRPAPAGPTTDRVNRAIAAVDGRQAAWGRAAARAADPTDPDRAAAADAARRAWAELDAALAEQAAAHPEWAALVRPPLPAELPAADGPRWIYRIGPQRAHLWVVPANGGAPTGYALPDRAQIEALTADLHPRSSRAEPWPTAGDADPHAETWAALAAAADRLIPAAARGGLDDRPLHIYADPPLDRLPLAALVLEPPARPGAAPVFLATGRPVLRRSTLGPDRTPAAGERFAAVGLNPADREALAETAPAETEPDAVAGAAVAHFGRAIDEATLAPGAPGLVIVDAPPPPPGPLARWAGIAEILSGTAGDPRAAAHLWSRLAARPLQPALVFAAGEPGAAGALLPADLPRSAEPLPPAEAVRRWRLDAMTRAAVPGRVPLHHPAHWARWRRIRP